MFNMCSINFHFYTILLVGVFVSEPVYGQSSDLTWVPIEDAVERAKVDQKPIMIDVWAPWCGWCKKMQKEVYPEVAESLESEFILTRLNRDDNNTKVLFKGQKLSQLRLAQKLKVPSVPAVVFLSADGNYLFHISGYISAQDFKQILIKTEGLVTELQSE